MTKDLAELLAKEVEEARKGSKTSMVVPNITRGDAEQIKKDAAEGEGDRL